MTIVARMGQLFDLFFWWGGPLWSVSNKYRLNPIVGFSVRCSGVGIALLYGAVVVGYANDLISGFALLVSTIGYLIAGYALFLAVYLYAYASEGS